MPPSETPAADADSYRQLLSEGRSLYPGVRIGEPGRARSYWLLISGMRVLRLVMRVRIQDRDNVAAGAAILVGNHVSHLDPVVVVITNWWRVSAFTKVEAFHLKSAPFFRLMGQIPLRRGDAAATDWALRMASDTLARGDKIGIYPEGTRSPDRGTLHKLHKRMLIPLLRENPEVPVHVVTTTYGRSAGLRRSTAVIRVSEPLVLNRQAMTADEIVDVIRDEMLALGGQTYSNIYAQEAKAALRMRRGNAS